MKKALCIILVFVMLFSAAPVFAAEFEGLIMQPGSDETGRNFSWYVPAGSKEAYVAVSADSSFENAKEYEAKIVSVPQGDCSAKVCVTGLEKNATYYYKAVCDGEEGDVYTFSTVSDEFSAMYVTDIHVSFEEDDPGSVERQSEMFASVLTKAKEKSDINLILSAGDQASDGRRVEYSGLVSAPVVKTVSFATCIGNHDRKGVDYRYFNNVPNEQFGTINSYQGGDYWFVKGPVLFMVCDSNSGNGEAHASLIKKAIESNPGAKWRVLVMHHDMWGQTMENRESENKWLRLMWTPIFDEYGIDLCLLGHSHYYSVSNVVYNGESVEKVTNGCTVKNAQGTVFMVSGSMNHPRSSDNFSYGRNIGFGVEDVSKIGYNIIDFSADEIRVHSYEYETGEEFASFTLSKTADCEKPDFGFGRVLVRILAGVIGKIYTFFNNIGRVTTLREDGYDVSYISGAFNSANTVDGTSPLC